MKVFLRYVPALIILGAVGIYFWVESREQAEEPDHLVPKVSVSPAPTTAATAAELPKMTMHIGNQDFVLEIARTESQQEKGLMDRPSLEADRGMLFIFPDMQVRTFWNHHVHFPLDLIFLDGAGKVVSLEHMDAENDAVVSSDVAAEYTIELNAGTAQRVGVQVGEQLDVGKK